MDAFTKYNTLKQEEIIELHRTKNLKIQVQGHVGCITALTQSSSHIYSGSDDKSIKCWMSKTFVQDRNVKCKNWVNCLVVYEDKYLFAAGADKSITIYEINNLQEIEKLSGYHRDYITSLLISNKRLYSASLDGQVIIWDIFINNVDNVTISEGTSLKPLFSIKNALVGELYTMTLDLHNRLYCAGTHKIIKVYDEACFSKFNQANDDDAMSLNVMTGHTHWIKALISTNHVLLSGSYDKTIRVWCLQTYDELMVLQGHTGYIQSFALLSVSSSLSKLNEDGEILLYSGSFDKTVRVWNIHLLHKYILDKNTKNNIHIDNSNSYGSHDLLKTTYAEYTDFIHTLMVSHDNRLLIAGCGDSLYLRSID